MFKKKSNQSISEWNANTSIFTMLNYILYSIIYKFELNTIFAKILISVIIINIFLILYTFFLTINSKNNLSNFPKKIFFIILRIIINVVLLFLVIDYYNGV